MREAAPWYVHPVLAPEAWERLLAGRYGLDFAVINIADGPGDGSDPAYDALLTRPRQVPLLGYVDAAYTARPIDSVRRDARAWRDRYRISGVMLDRVPRADPAWCAETAERLRADGCTFLAANVGTVPVGPVAGYDVVCTAELDWPRYQGLPPGSSPSLGGALTWHLIHGCPPSQRDAARRLAAERGADLAWISGATLPNPWCEVPVAEAVPVGR